MKKFFRIYLPFASNQFKRQMAYKGAFYLFVFCTLFGSFINYYLWMAIYGNNPNGTIGGLTRGEMVVYIFMSYVTSYIAMIGLSEDVSNDVVKGNVAMNLIKPIDYRMSLIFNAIGCSIYRFFAPCIFVWIGVECYRIFVLGLTITSIFNILLFLLSLIFSFLIYVLFDFCFGMIAFFTTYIFGISMVKDSLLAFLSGQLIPLTLFPEAIQKIFNYLPFSSIVYSPVMIYLGKYSTNQVLFVLLRQMIWVVLLYLFGNFIWKRVTKRLVVLGG